LAIAILIILQVGGEIKVLNFKDAGEVSEAPRPAGRGAEMKKARRYRKQGYKKTEDIPL
jgi:hypothetical protein